MSRIWMECARKCLEIIESIKDEDKVDMVGHVSCKYQR